LPTTVFSVIQIGAAGSFIRVCVCVCVVVLNISDVSSNGPFLGMVRILRCGLMNNILKLIMDFQDKRTIQSLEEV
jgi:hypothetical protein